MNQYELPAMMEDELPVIAAEIKQIGIHGNANSIIQLFAGYTKRMMSIHDLPSVMNCMNLADKMYKRGNEIVRNAIEKVFVISFAGLKEVGNKLEWNAVQAKMPIALFSIYVRQRLAHGNVYKAIR